ncbi:heavy metal translocating P-type ATPase [Sediminicola sp. 1XM1-17]|uniref:heavy metal translocating P-type ATPase n=1 Tax=Sediminicola sp. 1XM1-17 TaxID=3127702 RepID=UPI00307703EA
MSNSCEQCTGGTEPASNKNPSNTIWDKDYGIPVLCLMLLIFGIGLHYFEVSFFSPVIALLWFGTTYIIIGAPVLGRSAKLIAHGHIYNEFVLMSVATLGAFLIGSYAEGVAVMLFYVVGELFQESAVKKAKRSIEALLKIQVEEATVLENGNLVTLHPKKVQIGQTILVRQGQKIPLDGILQSEKTDLNTAALTGESLPVFKQKGELVYAGSINIGKPIEIRVTHHFEDTKLSKILKMVQDATSRKAKTQLLISRLAKVYTPIVFWLAVALVVLPLIFLGSDYIFETWFQRALIFLVISCPCALVISIPLGYFGGIGAGSRNGILFKGSNFLDLMSTVDTVVMDKTGTLTKGMFEVQNVHAVDIDKKLLLELTAMLEVNSTHPVAKAIVAYANIQKSTFTASHVEEISGHGLIGKVGEYTVLAGNAKLLDKYKVPYDSKIDSNGRTLVLIALNNTYAGYIEVADAVKEDAKEAVEGLYNLKIKEVIMLSGDQQAVVDKIAQTLGIKVAIGSLLPEEKLSQVAKLKNQGRVVAFVGDGINDAPVIAMADVGIAMGGLGSDAAVETADIVIQTDQPSKVATAIKISHVTKEIIWQNITLALGIKILVLLLGALGMATMWQAVIADVGVALLAILNAVRIQHLKF